MGILVLAVIVMEPPQLVKVCIIGNYFSAVSVAYGPSRRIMPERCPISVLHCQAYVHPEAPRFRTHLLWKCRCGLKTTTRRIEYPSRSIESVAAFVVTVSEKRTITLLG